jgi:hypothetical protein
MRGLLTLRISVGGALCDERPAQLTLEVFQIVMKRLASDLHASQALQELYAQVLGHDNLKFGMTSFAAIAGRRALQFNPHELLCWLQSTPFSGLKTPNPNQLLEILRFRDPPRGALASYLTLLKVHPPKPQTRHH